MNKMDAVNEIRKFEVSDQYLDIHIRIRLNRGD